MVSKPVQFICDPPMTNVIQIFIDEERCHLSVEHDGTITWDQLQEIKSIFWGEIACAIEIYPPAESTVNNCQMRHLWKLGPDDWWPDLSREGWQTVRTLRECHAAIFGGCE